MIAVILFVSLVFLSIGLFINRNNAVKIFSPSTRRGRSETSEAETIRLALQSRRLHLIMGITTLVAGLGLLFVAGDTASLLFIIFFPITAYVYYFVRYVRPSPGQPSWLTPFVVILLIVVALIMLGLFRAGYAVNAFHYEADHLNIKGMYGETLRPADIAYIEVIDSLPAFRTKLNGFATGQILKGIFLTKEKQRVKLLIDNPDGPFLHIRRVSGDDLYMAFRTRPAETMLLEFQQHYPLIEVR